MKKIAPNRLLWYVLIAVSTSCYIYLQTSPYPVEAPYSSTQPHPSEGLGQQEDQAEPAHIMLPDVDLVKKILNLTKVVSRKY